MNYTPLRSDVIVKLPEEVKQTQSGLFIATTVETHQIAEVVGVGEGDVHPRTGDIIPLTVKIGDNVVITRGSGLMIDEKERILLIKEKDIFGLMN